MAAHPPPECRMATITLFSAPHVPLPGWWAVISRACRPSSGDAVFALGVLRAAGRRASAQAPPLLPPVSRAAPPSFDNLCSPWCLPWEADPPPEQTPS